MARFINPNAHEVRFFRCRLDGTAVAEVALLPWDQRGGAPPHRVIVEGNANEFEAALKGRQITKLDDADIEKPETKPAPKPDPDGDETPEKVTTKKGK